MVGLTSLGRSVGAKIRRLKYLTPPKITTTFLNPSKPLNTIIKVVLELLLIILVMLLMVLDLS